MNTFKSLKLFVVVPGESRGPFFMYLSSMIHTTAAAEVDVVMTNPRGSDLVSVRTRGVIDALNNDATHILWVDSDILMPANSALNLMSHELEIVAANYVMRDGSMQPVSSIGPDRVSSSGKKGLEKVSSTGMGLMLTDINVYKKMVFPWFGHRWHRSPEDPKVVGLPADMNEWPSTFEDVYFCDRAAQSNIDVYIDHDLSQDVGHLGNCVYYQSGMVAI